MNKYYSKVHDFLLVPILSLVIYFVGSMFVHADFVLAQAVGLEGSNEELIVDTTGPNVDVYYPVTGDYVSGGSVINFFSDDFESECSFDGLAWSSCQSEITTMADIAGFGSVVDGAMTLFIRSWDDDGNITEVQMPGIIKDTVAPIGTISTGFDGYITEQILSFDITIAYDETINVDYIPTISFGETTGVITASNEGSWDNNIWTQSFVITDGNELRENIPISSFGAVDLAGNIEIPRISGSMNVDTKNPQATISISNKSIRRGDLLQTVTVNYDEEMNTEMTPDIYFTKTVDWSLLNSEWSTDKKTYMATFLFIGQSTILKKVNAYLPHLESSFFMEDINGNSEVDSMPSAFFKIDTMHQYGLRDKVK